jgi:hypothetical protein
MLSEVISEASKTNASEEVNGISSVARLVLREHATVESIANTKADYVQARYHISIVKLQRVCTQILLLTV